MFDKIKVSVVIPIWNTEHYLEKCLESLIHQTLEEIEIICVNNGSSDSCAKILEDYRKNDDRIKIITIEHGYLSDARNLGIKEATGEYLYCIDSDDWLELTALEKWYNQAKSKNADVVLIQEKRLSEEFQTPVNTNHVSLELYGCDDNGVYTYKDLKKLFMSRYCAWMHFYNRNFFIENDLFYPSKTFYEDVSVHFKTLFTAKRIAVVLEPLHNYYVRIASSYAQSHNNPVKLDVIKFVEALYDILTEKHLTKLYKYEFVNWLFGELKGHFYTSGDNYKSQILTLFDTFISNHNEIKEYIELNQYYSQVYKNLHAQVQKSKKNIFKRLAKGIGKLFKYLTACICFPYYIYKSYKLIKRKV